MSEPILDESLHFLFDKQNQFDDSKSCILWIKGKAKEGYPVKKKIKAMDKISFKNIKSIQEARYGENENNAIDVLTEVNRCWEKDQIITNFMKSNETLNSFINQLLKVICPRCYNSYAHTKLNPHNHGYLNMRIMESAPQSILHIFPGIIKCYIAYVVNEDKNIILKKKDRYIEIFSDLIVNRNVSNLPHFEVVNTIYNFMMVQRENNKINNINNNDEYKKLEKKMKLSTLIPIKTLFLYQLPVLRYLAENKSNLFIRHGLEKKTDDYKKRMIFPPNDDKHGWRIHNVTTPIGTQTPTIMPTYAVEVDQLPFKRCASHSCKEIYGNVKGFIALNDFKMRGGKIRMRYENNDTENTLGRDHLFAESTIPIQYWIFTYIPAKNSELKELIQKAVTSLLREELPILDERLIPNFIHVFEAITNKFILLH